MSRVVRLVDRASEQTCREYVLDGLTTAEIRRWFADVASCWDQVRFKIEFPRDFSIGETDV